MSWLVNSMEEDIAANYLGHPTAKAMWDNLSQMYSDLGNQSQIYEIELKISVTKQGTESVTRYFSGLKRLWQDLDMFFDHKWKDAADGVYFQKVLENNQVFKFLAGLNVDFDEVRGRIIGRQPLPSLNEVFAEVRREESRRWVMLGNKNSSSTPVETSALVSQDISAYKGYTRKPDDKPKVWCDHCNKPRHTRDTCWKLHGKPANWKPREKSIPAAYAADKPFFNKDQINQLLKLITPSSEGSSSVPSVDLEPNKEIVNLESEFVLESNKDTGPNLETLESNLLLHQFGTNSGGEISQDNHPNLEHCPNTELQVYTRTKPPLSNRDFLHQVPAQSKPPRLVSEPQMTQHEDQPQDIVLLWVEIWSLGEVKNKVLLLEAVQKQSIGQQH
ncbi:hypothetical protein ACOSP7_031239 [Xanthoceras sorbifolium]